MKRICFLCIGLFLIMQASHAQKGNNQISIGPEVDLPIGSFGDAYSVGFGGTIKGLYGIGSAGQVTLTTGYLHFKGKSGTTNGYSFAGQTFSIIPYLVGYRHNFKPWYVEPQLGLASYNTKAGSFKFSETRFTYGLGAGYMMNNLDLGLRLQSHTGATLLAFRAAYSFNFGK